MADNTTIDNGALSDYVVADDDDGVAKHQYVKVEWGGDGVFNKVAAGAAALPIQDGGNSITVDGTVGVSGTIVVDTELGAAAALTDNFANPTVPGVGAFLMGWDGSAWDRVSAPSGVLQVSSTISGSVTVDTELAAAVALADNLANPTVPGVGSYLLGYDGATWDRLQATQGALTVDIVRVAGVQATVGVPIAASDGTSAIESLLSGADNTANTVNELVTAAMGYVFDGSTWDRLRGDSVGGAFAQGPAAHDAAAAGNPLLAGAQMETPADSAPGTRAGTDGDVVKLASIDGALFVVPSGPQQWSLHFDGSTAQTDTTVHAAPGAGLSLYVTDIVFSSGAATAINLFFEEGSTKVLGPYYLEAVAGRGFAIHFNTPKKITANTALTFTTSAAIAHALDVTGFIAPG